MLEQFIDFLAQTRPIPPEDAAIIGRHLQTRQVKEGEVLIAPDQYARELYFILSGILKINGTNSKGDEVIRFFIPENRLCTILYSFQNNTPSGESVIAACDTEVIVFTHKILDNIYSKVPYLKALLDGIIQQALLKKIAVMSTYLGEDATARYQNFLQQQPNVANRVSLQDIASHLEITPQSLSRIRRAVRNL
jgi:CRP/FNR family transcriptional regulator, anaerobic regulatory protein